MTYKKRCIWCNHMGLLLRESLVKYIYRLGFLQILFKDLSNSLQKGIFISQKKYVLDLLKDFRLLDAKPCETPKDLNVKLIVKEREEFLDIKKYR
ncbi:Uncharacterized protein TCM_033629 [Theobroma cacao]|uniref:Reverse transcriptase Ty1/copia-type domain-containing protein n=1 Tax=Theobroma cacao TaxID=3641 RepID=A0A061FII7_THECC|nr:Uncharacterized protein TCM_033629 [Theobroma cacao]